MTPELKARWVKALRSGRYKQAKSYAGFLVNGKEHNCCLGVLARIARCATFNGVDRKVPRLNNANGTPLPLAVLNPSMQLTLAEMNDSPQSFAFIADFIEGSKEI